MTDKIILLKQDEVISINNSKEVVVVSHTTFKAGEFLDGLLEKMHHDLERRMKWAEGVECEILSPNTGWKKGKIRVAIEFIPEESESVLDDIRQKSSY